MLLAHDLLEDSLASRTLDRMDKKPGNRCYLYAQVRGGYRFHIDAAQNASLPPGGWVHYVTGDIQGLLDLCTNALDKGWAMRVTLQTPFLKGQPYVISEVLEVAQGYDKFRKEYYFCKCSNGETYAMSPIDQTELTTTVTVWP